MPGKWLNRHKKIKLFHPWNAQQSKHSKAQKLSRRQKWSFQITKAIQLQRNNGDHNTKTLNLSYDFNCYFLHQACLNLFFVRNANRISLIIHRSFIPYRTNYQTKDKKQTVRVLTHQTNSNSEQLVQLQSYSVSQKNNIFSMFVAGVGRVREVLRPFADSIHSLRVEKSLDTPFAESIQSLRVRGIVSFTIYS